MSISPTVGLGAWVEPPPPVETLSTSIDYFQAQTIVREQDVEELTRVCNVLRDTQAKLESNEINSSTALSILAEFKTEKFKNKHPDAIMQQSLLRVMERFDEKLATK
jgi:phage gp16-like protein